MTALPATYPCRACGAPIARWGARCNPCRGLPAARVIPGSTRRSNCYHRRDERALAAMLREAERRRILRGDPCGDCGEVCIGIEDCVRRIAASIRRARVAA